MGHERCDNNCLPQQQHYCNIMENLYALVDKELGH